jgi:hypothetical protein
VVGEVQGNFIYGGYYQFGSYNRGDVVGEVQGNFIHRGYHQFGSFNRGDVVGEIQGNKTVAACAAFLLLGMLTNL